MSRTPVHQKTAGSMPPLQFWLVPLYTPCIVMLLGLILYTAACAIHYLYHLTHP